MHSRNRYDTAHFDSIPLPSGGVNDTTLYNTTLHYTLSFLISDTSQCSATLMGDTSFGIAGAGECRLISQLTHSVITKDRGLRCLSFMQWTFARVS